MYRRQHGFTLIELMIAFGIVAILASIAYPSYLTYMQRAQRIPAKNALYDLASREARYYSTNNTFTDLATLGYTVQGGSVQIPIGSASVFYDLTLAYTTTTFTATATPVNQQSTDSCGTYTLDNFGNQTPTTSGCW
jgi:type IV pilus assembly protein PilE